MENKKQLIIIPPMSEALKKLHEVLEGISGDENMEITLVDDLKELSQFLGTTGQCLILASNAKKCATFLQENRFILAKHHCKTILFTPKEIPAKTLIKFTKIGLTESILESSPPKTFLYKVKLLLRSIKTAKPQDEGDKLVKSLEGKTAQTAEEEKEIKEKDTREENVIDIDRPNKKKNETDENVIDYGNPLKGKIKPQEETIDTHWKSDRKKDDTIAEEEEGNMTSESEVSSIDMYYRGKRKKTEDLLPVEEERAIKTSDPLEAEEEEKRKKSSYADVIDEGSIKQKKLDVVPEEEAEKEKISLVDLDLEQASNKKRREENPEEELDPKARKKDKELEPVQEKEKKPDEAKEDLGGYLKGKITRQEEEVEEDFTDKKEVAYDNSDIEEKDPTVELDLLAADQKARTKNNDEEEDEQDAHEGEVDKIDGNMIGDASTVDKIRTRMEGRSEKEKKEKLEDDEELDLRGRKKSEEKEEKEREQKDNVKLEPESRERKTETDNAESSDEDFREKKAPALALEAADKERPKLDEAAEKERFAKLSPLEKLAEVRAQRAEREKREEQERERKKAETAQLDLEPGSDRQTHTSQVDKIDTFYRGGESKKKDHNWDNLTDKKTELELLPGKAKRADDQTTAKESKDFGEITIDYKKLKEEFDMISMGGTVGESGAIRHSGSTSLKNDDDEGSFKVVEIDPKSLDFSIAIINTIYQKDVKPKQIFAMLADELLSTYHCYPVFYTYKLTEKKFSESYNTFLETVGDKITAEKKEWWLEKKKDSALFEHFQTKSMTTWRCPEIIQNSEVWEDVELPTWAEQELSTKAVELAFPYFDGVDRMGLAVVFFPEGIKAKEANGILTALEMARTLFLDTIQRYQVQPIKEETREAIEEAPKEEKKNVLSFFGGLFGKKKAS